MNAQTRMVDDLKEMLHEQIEYRELLARMVHRDLLLRYKQTVMGFGWAICMPVVNTLIFSIIFMRVAQVETPVPYPLFAYCGLLAWHFTASSLRFAVGSLTANTSLVTKVYFPREIFPFTAVAVSLADFVVGSTLLIPLLLWYQVEISWPILLLPLIVAVQVAFTAGIALLLAMGNLFYRDVKYLFDIVLGVWMFATSVVYPLDRVGGIVGMALAANPMTHIIDAYRAVVLYGRPPDAAAFLATATVSVGILAAGWSLFHRAEFRFAENI